jgi:hypothetical protein
VTRVIGQLGLALTLAGLAVASGCGNTGDATVEGVLLAQADGVADAPAGATVAADEKNIDTVAVPAGARLVRLALGRKVLWTQVQALARRVEAAGARPVFLAGNWQHVKELRLEDDWPGGPAIQVIAYVDGKACVQPPGAIEAKCVQSGTKKYIERAYLRELVREQVKMFDVTQVEVDLPSTLSWDDVVRTIDGARTCCEGTKVRVRLRPSRPPAAGEPAPAADSSEPG